MSSTLRRALAPTVVTGALVAAGLFSAADPAPLPTSAPLAGPDRITLNPTTDNATTQTVTWRTKPGVTAPRAELSPDTANPWGYTKTVVTAEESQTQTTAQGYEQTFHSATFTGLQPGTTYLYRVNDGTAWSPYMPFTTSDPSATSTSLIAMGDIQTGIAEQWTRVAAAAVQDRPDARALITVGDQINTWNNEDQWHQLFSAGGTVPRQMQWLPAVGNHEYRSTDSGELSPQFRAQFDLPDNGPDDFPHFDETVYYTDIDDVRLVTLNSYYRIPLAKADEQRWLDAQASWLDGILTDNPREFTIVTMHYPVYSSSPDRGNPELRATLEPVLEKHNVDLVLQGHDHAYVSGQRDATNATHESGPVFVTSSSSIRQYPLDYSDWIENGAEIKTAFHSRSTYQLIDVEGDTMTYTAKDSTGLVVDQWSIKHTGNKNVVRHLGGIGIQ